MLLGDVILGGVATASLVGLALVVGRKLPLVSQVNTHDVSLDREERVKRAILEQRLKRRIKEWSGSVASQARPLIERTRGAMTAAVDRLAIVEQKYRKQLLARRAAESPQALVPKLLALEIEARALFDREAFAEAEQKCIEMVALDSRSIPAYRLLGEISLAQKKYAEAHEVYEFLLKLNREDADALAHLGSIEQHEGNLSAAREDVERAVAADQAVAATHLQLGEIYRELGELPRAVVECQAAVTLEPNNPRYLAALLDVAILANDKLVAWTTLDQLKSANPENQRIAELTQQVEAIGRTR